MAYFPFQTYKAFLWPCWHGLCLHLKRLMHVATTLVCMKSYLLAWCSIFPTLFASLGVFYFLLCSSLNHPSSSQRFFLFHRRFFSHIPARFYWPCLYFPLGNAHVYTLLMNETCVYTYYLFFNHFYKVINQYIISNTLCCSFVGTPSLEDRGFRGRSSTNGLVGLKPKLAVLHPSMLGTKLSKIFQHVMDEDDNTR